jgi:prevent-host-death family protein
LSHGIVEEERVDPSNVIAEAGKRHAKPVSATSHQSQTMSVRVTVRELQERLPELLHRAVETGEEYIIQHDGEDYAVIVSAREWQRRTDTNGSARSTTATADEEEERAREIGRRLDAMGPEYRLSPEKQQRMEELLARQQAAPLAPADRRELEALAEECDEIMLRRAQALHKIG